MMLYGWTAGCVALAAALAALPVDAERPALKIYTNVDGLADTSVFRILGAGFTWACPAAWTAWTSARMAERSTFVITRQPTSGRRSRSRRFPRPPWDAMVRRPRRPLPVGARTGPAP